MEGGADAPQPGGGGGGRLDMVMTLVDLYTDAKV